MNKQILIAPSILAADFGNLSAECSAMEAAGADWLHVDVMDGHFVNNITFGPDQVRAVRRAVGLPLDVHLMISEPARYFERFLDAGADILTFHIEAIAEPASILSEIRRRGKRCGLVLKPATPPEAVLPYLSYVDVVMVMTVEPGFGGQSLQIELLEKFRVLRAAAPDLLLEVDGGINAQNVSQVTAAGCNVIVAGSALFGGTDYREKVATMRGNC